MAKTPRTGEAVTVNYGWTKPTVDASDDAWGGMINTDLDGIDSTVKGVSTVANAAYPASNPSGYQTAAQVTAAVPVASSTTPAMNGAAAVGAGTTWARADHVHPTDTTLLPKVGGTLTGPLSATSATFSGNVQASGFFVDLPAGSEKLIYGRSSGVQRWALSLGDGSAENPGTSQGSNFALYSYGDGGGLAFTPIKIVRNTGVTTFSSAIVNGPSDRSLKENITPLEGSLEKVMALQGVAFNMIATPSKREIGLIAQDVEPIVPEVMQIYEHTEEGKAAGDKLALDYPKLTALLIEAVKELSAEVNALKTGAR